MNLGCTTAGEKTKTNKHTFRHKLTNLHNFAYSILNELKMNAEMQKQ